MCIAEPMQLIDVQAHRASALGRSGVREIDIALVAPAHVGEWVLVFLDAARERIDAERAAEVNAMLDLVASVGATGTAAELGTPVFELPSAQSLSSLQALTGQGVDHE